MQEPSDPPLNRNPVTDALLDGVGPWRVNPGLNLGVQSVDLVLDLSLGAPRTRLRRMQYRLGLPAGTPLRRIDGNMIAVPHDCDAELPAGAAAKVGRGPQEYAAPDDRLIRARAGAVIELDAGGAVYQQDRMEQGPVRVKAGGKITVPAHSTIALLTRCLAFPGGSDILVEDMGTLCLAADLEPGGPPPPAFSTRVTVAEDAEVIAPYHGMQETLDPQKKQQHPIRHFRVPQGGNSLAGTMGMVILAALVTMFGIGAQIGIVAVLALRLSQANDLGQVIGWIIVAVVVAFILRYSVTAIRTLANPQPGSSMNTTAGTSFTL
jgi:hypothetical protein